MTWRDRNHRLLDRVTIVVGWVLLVSSFGISYPLDLVFVSLAGLLFFSGIMWGWR